MDFRLLSFNILGGKKKVDRSKVSSKINFITKE